MQPGAVREGKAREGMTDNQLLLLRVAPDAVFYLGSAAADEIIHQGQRLGIAPATVLRLIVRRGLSRLQSEERFKSRVRGKRFARIGKDR